MKILKVLWILGYGLAVLAYPVAGVLGSGAEEVQMITPYAPEMVELNRSLVSKAELSDPDKVIRIYGNADGEPVKVLFVDPATFIRPKEMESLVLLPVDKQKGEDPLQYQMVLFFAKMTTICSVIGSSLLLGLWFLLRSRKKKAAPAESSAPSA